MNTDRSTVEDMAGVTGLKRSIKTQPLRIQRNADMGTLSSNLNNGLSTVIEQQSTSGECGKVFYKGSHV